MSRNTRADVLGGILGLLVGLLLWSIALGIQVRQHEPGLWAMRFRRILDCGLDYNGPPFTDGQVTIWVTCGSDDNGWRLWPP